MITKRAALLISALSVALPAIATDEPPAILERPAEIVIMGSGKVIEALHRAVEEEVAGINADGGVMGQPLKLRWHQESCEAKPVESLAAVREIAKQQPLLAFAQRCKTTADEVADAKAAAFGEANIILMQVPINAPCSTQTSNHPTVFCLSPTSPGTQETAFFIAAEQPGKVITIYPEIPDAERSVNDVQKQLNMGFEAKPDEEARWGKLLPPRTIDLSQHRYPLGAPLGLEEIGRIAADIGETPSSAVIYIGASPSIAPILSAATLIGWKGKLFYFPLPTKPPPEWLKLLSQDAEAYAITEQPFYLGAPPEGAKAYTAFHPDWFAGVWQVMKAVKYAKSLDGREIAKTLGGKPFFSRAPWLMLQSRSRYVPHELRQRFNDNGTLRMAGYKLEKTWPK